MTETYTPEQAADIIKKDLVNHLNHLGVYVKKGKNFKCVNPAHDDKHPSMGIRTGADGYPRAHCFACEADYDTFDLIGIEFNLTDPKAIFEKAYDLYGFNVEYPPQPGYQKGYIRYANDGKPSEFLNFNSNSNVRKQNQNEAEIERSEKDYNFTDVIDAAHAELKNHPKTLDYLHGRGMTDDIIEAYKIGYSPDGYNAMIKEYNLPETGAHKEALYKIVFPCMDSDGHATYFYTEITDRNQTDEYNPKYRAIKGMTKPLFNERYIKTREPVIFICEGIYDALSVEIAGGKAIALFGAGQNRLIELAKESDHDTVFIIALDNDDAGKKAIERIKEGLDKIGRDYIIHTAKTGKDFNEALQDDPEQFKADIAEAIEQAESKRGEKIAERRDKYLRENSALYDLPGFVERISNSATNPPIKTGFDKLDKALDGGLYEGLYIIGAVTSTGKTTLTLQMADNIAKSGHDVLIFSLEMGADELKAKTISRLTLLDCLERQKTDKDTNLLRLAKTSRGIMTGARYEHYSDDEKQLIFSSIDKYKEEYARHIFINEGIGNIGAKQIKETVIRHKEVMGTAPIVIVDYLQILAPYDIRATDKQNIDKAVLELKRLSRDLHTTVFCVSSLNRSGYDKKVTLANFKESGAIEYGADVLLGLDFTGANIDGFDPAEAKRESPRKMTLNVLKNRNGATGTEINFLYHTLFNYFIER